MRIYKYQNVRFFGYCGTASRLILNSSFHPWCRFSSLSLLSPVNPPLHVRLFSESSSETQGTVQATLCPNFSKENFGTPLRASNPAFSTPSSPCWSHFLPTGPRAVQGSVSSSPPHVKNASVPISAVEVDSRFLFFSEHLQV